MCIHVSIEVIVMPVCVYTCIYRGYCYAGVCIHVSIEVIVMPVCIYMYLYMYLCFCSPISQYNFVKCWPILTKLDVMTNFVTS